MSQVSKALHIEGQWGSFVPRKNLKSLARELKSYAESDVLIYFEDARISMLFISFLKELLVRNRIKNVYVYSDDKLMLSMLHQLNSDKFNLFINGVFLPFCLDERTECIVKKRSYIVYLMDFIGRKVVKALNHTVLFLNFLGLVIYSFLSYFVRPQRFRIGSVFYNMSNSGFKALFIGVVTAFIVGFAISLQGALQLNSLGVPLMSIDTTAKLSLREMGPFILALVIAGRSASSYTAEIGSMKLTEEMQAMNTMNLNVMHFLVLPRVIALIIVMPLMTFVADAFALFGGMLAIKASLNIGFEQYIDRFYESVALYHFWIGIIKAPFFGFVVAIVGCFYGFLCSGNTQSIGKYTTRSVVSALFWIIVVNAIFSLIFSRLDL
ncbi:hypothetical protein BKH43_02565 [Helicobacter sp. 13S00401-1]|uniref:MlaE family ABC transporter permease n=1 Tax=Helicobacter sp. 13S00401-1 TaxID=1905758 RepID=UPI000BA588CB|nr:ABC transporter permease [Helicobacter sp. 13S00401-1]PAF51108.1 hypothetical protein BKH43_02565 [Helicobacter sp. 13S00401-1]